MKRVISFGSRSDLTILCRQKTGEHEASTEDTSSSSSATSAVGSMSSAAASQSDLDFSAWSINKRNEVASVYCYNSKSVTSSTTSTSSQSSSHPHSAQGSVDFASMTKTLYAKTTVRGSSSATSSTASSSETRYAAPAPISPRSSAEFDLHSDSSMSDTESENLELPPAAPLKPKSQAATETAVATAAAPVKKKAQRCRLVFNENVTVFPIPRTSDLTDSQRINLWGTKADRIAAMRRNAMEYAYEGMNWRNVLEEDSMAVVGQYGHQERIHPVHLSNCYNDSSSSEQDATQSRSMQSTRTRTTYLPSSSAGAVRWHTAAPP